MGFRLEDSSQAGFMAQDRQSTVLRAYLQATANPSIALCNGNAHFGGLGATVCRHFVQRSNVGVSRPSEQ